MNLLINKFYLGIIYFVVWVAHFWDKMSTLGALQDILCNSKKYKNNELFDKSSDKKNSYHIVNKNVNIYDIVVKYKIPVTSTGSTVQRHFYGSTNYCSSLVG